MWEKKLLRKIYGEVRVDETSGDVKLMKNVCKHLGNHARLPGPETNKTNTREKRIGLKIFLHFPPIQGT